jgi:hypothetical protein
MQYTSMYFLVLSMLLLILKIQQIKIYHSANSLEETDLRNMQCCMFCPQ